ncbi:hypothetical protein [Variovorax sp. YR216]|uniref:hypothetical protein n=1 Tax=Variovorax sp. YR216 TaxID=1882828 RepID=UPI0008951D1E|nr:hypothetical protein [Variovorax sp. YR216]SEA87177.1 hypothetical protein SAMN05444680_10472 [Variovorax sp. YR216]
MARRKLSRFALLSEDQRKLISSEPGSVVIGKGLLSFVGPAGNLSYYQEAYGELESLLKDWRTKDYWLTAFQLYANSPDLVAPSAYGSAVSDFKCGFWKFVAHKHDESFALQDLSQEYIDSFETWLEEDESKIANNRNYLQGAKRSPNTNRRYYAFARRLVGEMYFQANPDGSMPSPAIFRNRAFVDAHRATTPTRVLSDVEWEALHQTARRVALAIKQKVEQDWVILEGAPIQANNQVKNRSKYKDRACVLWELRKLYPNHLIPSRQEIRSVDKLLDGSITHVHGYRDVVISFAPSVETIFPFMLLLAIYSQPNTGPLTGLKSENITNVSVLGADRIIFEFLDEELNSDSIRGDTNDFELEGRGDATTGQGSERVAFEWEKPRIHSSYVRSFAVDTVDPLSPSEIWKFVEKWTRGIRPLAGPHSGYLFIFAGNTRKVRAFLNAAGIGVDDICWRHAFKMFCRENGLARTNISEVRMTGLNKVSEVTGGDLVSVREAAGHRRGSSTVTLHYEGDGARLQKNERLGEVAGTMERWATTRGRSHVRGAPDDTDLGAATPGWHCLDPFDSPLQGERKGRLCQGFGRCPDCPLATLDITSPYSFARAFQLLRETELAQEYLPVKRWLAVYRPVQMKLRAKWLPSFSIEVVEAAKSLNLGPIGRLE